MEESRIQGVGGGSLKCVYIKRTTSFRRFSSFLQVFCLLIENCSELFTVDALTRFHVKNIFDRCSEAPKIPLFRFLFADLITSFLRLPFHSKRSAQSIGISQSVLMALRFSLVSSIIAFIFQFEDCSPMRALSDECLRGEHQSFRLHHFEPSVSFETFEEIV